MNLLYELPSSSRRKAIQPESQPGSRLHALPSRIHIFHNILWPKYKGLIFSGIHSITSTGNLDIAFFQIARTSSDRKNLADVDTSYHRYPYELLFDSAYDAIPKSTLCKRLFSQVWRSDADLIVLPGYHLTEYWMMLLACVLTRKKRAVFVDSTGNDQPDTKWKYWLKRLFFNLCDGFFAYGQRSKEYLLTFNVPASKITTRCQAAALPHAYSPEQAQQERIARRNDSMPPSFLFVGLLSEGKGIDLLLHAFRKLRQKNPSATLIVVGDGPMRDELKALAASLGVAEAVRFPGAANIEQLAAHYLNASCLVLPSRSEAWGLVVNEALSYGCPAIVSAHCGCAPDLIFEGKTGYVFRTNDADDLAAKMTLVVSNMNNVPAVARDCIELMRTFTPHTAAAQILNGCKAILDNRREAA
jgi:glycosyltransferase involved in cell wall biosynthesis